MDTRNKMVIVKGEVKTSEIISCKYNYESKKWEVTFKNNKKYTYAYQNVEMLSNPTNINHNMYSISKDGRPLYNIEYICEFISKNHGVYWHICYTNGYEVDYRKNELNILSSCLIQKETKNVFEYLKEISELSNLRNEETDEKLLPKKYSKINFVGNDVALAKYLNPDSLQNTRNKGGYIPIFPFGCNNSQYKAVKNAMENQISVIQGPPGTGKTQTILNIIANILMQGKSLQIVSNNNSATENVYEKLSSSKYNLGFVVATLGNSENKKKFIENQNTEYLDFSTWIIQDNSYEISRDVDEKSVQLKKVFDNQEKLAALRQELSQLDTEYEHFKEYVNESDVNTDIIISKKKLSSKECMNLWIECQSISENNRKIGLLFRLRAYLKYGIMKNFYKQDISKIITTFQNIYYRTKRMEVADEISNIENYLNGVSKNLTNELCEISMEVLKDKLARKYNTNSARTQFNEEDLWRNSDAVLKEYPVILSTTFSSRNSLNTNVVYDYIIMDEASQVDIATGALALSCAKNVVIVGDTKQLSNVVKDEDKTRAKAIFDKFNINDGYMFTKSFLQSVLEIIPNVTQTLLREHYRCHPKIINFCNQKFYHGELIIMTEDKGEEDVLAVTKTARGNHERNRYSQRQVDVIKEEVIPKYKLNPEETGIIAPYNNQVEALNKEVSNFEAATVHKFQGREKDNIIISTVDDVISDFADDPYLINVAVSRAKKKLILVVTGNELPKERNITDLVEYIQYNNFEVSDSKIYSVFDYLYKQYTKEREAYLQKYKKISEFNSENLMYKLIKDILSEDKYAALDVVCHFSLNMLIKNPEFLNEQECKYAMNPNTHLDFLIYNRISKKPVLAIEVDGYEYHKKGTVQASRDILKNHIMELYAIKLLRFMTNGSGEKQKIIETLEELLK